MVEEGRDGNSFPKETEIAFVYVCVGEFGGNWNSRRDLFGFFVSLTNFLYGGGGEQLTGNKSAKSKIRFWNG